MLSPLEQQLGNIHQQPAGESGPASQAAQGNTVAAAAASRASPATSSQQVCKVVLPVYGKLAAETKHLLHCSRLLQCALGISLSPVLSGTVCAMISSQSLVREYLALPGMYDAHFPSGPSQYMLLQFNQKIILCAPASRCPTVNVLLQELAVHDCMALSSYGSLFPNHL